MLSIKNIIQAKRFLPSNSQPSQAFQTFCSFKGSKKVIFLDTSLGSKNPSKNRPRHRGPPQFKNMCGHKCSPGVENKCLRRCKTMEKQRHGKLLSRACRNNRTSCYFSPGDLKILPTKRPPFWGSKNGPQNGGHSFSLNLICLCPDDLAPVLGSRKLDPKTGAVCRQNFCRQAKNSASFDCFRRCATEVLHTAGPLGSHGFAAPRAIVLHALRTFMPTPVLELFKNMCGHKCSPGVENKCLRRCKTMEKQRHRKLLSRTCRNNRTSCYFSPGDLKILPTKRPPFWGPKTDPKMEATHSVSI